MGFTFIGFREVQTQFPGARCSVCGETMERRQKCMYSSIVKEFRHIVCHFDHPANLCEIWLADKTETNEETFEDVTRRTVIITDTCSRETGAAWIRSNRTVLVQMLESFPKGSKSPVQVRRQHLATITQEEVSPTC